jgi:hypothetical protein
MSLLRLIGPQGIAGIVVAACLALLLIVQKVESRHWRKQSARFEELARKGDAERAGIVADFAAAAEAARAADRANAARVSAEQSAINRSSNDDFEARIARARADALRLRQDTAAPADRGHAEASPVPRLPASPGRADEAPRQDRLPDPERLIATEQAIQLDELIKWVRAQAAVDPSGPPSE